MPKSKKLTFEIHPSGYLSDTFANIKHGNGQVVFTSETKDSKQSNLKAIRAVIKAVQSGNFRIVEFDKDECEVKEYKA